MKWFGYACFHLVLIVTHSCLCRLMREPTSLLTPKSLLPLARKYWVCVALNAFKSARSKRVLIGPYVWGRYDILLLPPSFPYGGMENPCLTFVTPTLLAGDRSLVNVVAHEVSQVKCIPLRFVFCGALFFAMEKAIKHTRNLRVVRKPIFLEQHVLSLTLCRGGTRCYLASCCAPACWDAQAYLISFLCCYCICGRSKRYIARSSRRVCCWCGHGHKV